VSFQLGPMRFPRKGRQLISTGESHELLRKIPRGSCFHRKRKLMFYGSSGSPTGDDHKILQSLIPPR
jgi:hypothetical protein